MPDIPDYPYKPAALAEPPDEVLVRSLARAAGVTGPGLPPRRVPPAVRQREAAEVPWQSRAELNIPNWVRAHIERGATYEEVLERMQKRVLKAPTERNLRLAEALINEFARTEQGTALARRFIKQEIVDKLFARGK